MIVFYRTFFTDIPSTEIKYDRRDMTMGSLFGYGSGGQTIGRRRNPIGFRDGDENENEILSKMPMGGGWGWSGLLVYFESCYH